MDADGLAALTAASPLALRVLVGVLGVALLLAGARLYRVALFGSCFALGAVGAAVGLAWAGTQVPALAAPEVVGLGALLTGVAVAGVAALAHRVALLAAGGILGLCVGAGVGDLLGGTWAMVAPGAGVLIGALAFPWVFDGVLRLVMPAVGAVSVAWALGRPDTLWLVLALWAVGAAVQVGLVRSRSIAPGQGAG